MADKSVRFGVGDPNGARSTEWVVTWKTRKSDVYVACRVLGKTMKVSLHESGECHIHAPASALAPDGTPLRYTGKWNIDPAGAYAFPFSIIVPASELRKGSWARQRDKDTVWVQAGRQDASIRIGVFLTRQARNEAATGVVAAGWQPPIVLEQLTDGRLLIVAASQAPRMPAERRQELESLKTQVRCYLARLPKDPTNPRLLLHAVSADGMREYVDAAVYKNNMMARFLRYVQRFLARLRCPRVAKSPPPQSQNATGD